jgi:hypothetical protein
MADETAAEQQDAAREAADETTRAVGAAALAEPREAEAIAPTRPDGIALDGHGLPVNHRLRAAALAERGDDEDPHGEISADLISEERGRLAAYDSEYPLTSGATKAQLEKLAEAEGVDISGASNNEERAALIDAARPARI